MAEQLSNSLATTTLAADLAIDGTSLTLTSDAEFPAGPTFRVALFDNRYNPTAIEIVTVTAGGNGIAFPWTITRAQEGTTAAAWESGDYAACVLTADGLGDYVSETVAAAIAAVPTVAAHVAEADPHAQYALETALGTAAAEDATAFDAAGAGAAAVATHESTYDHTAMLDETAHDALDHTGLTGIPSTAGLLDETGHDALDHSGLTGIPSVAGLLDETAHDALDHTGLTGIPSISGLLDETAHDALDHTGLTGVLSSLPDHAHAGVAGDGGTFDAANLTSGEAADGHVLTADGSGGAAWEAPPAGGAVDAGDVTYTPTTAADWDSDTDPGNVDDALDQLAERVADVEGASATRKGVLGATLDGGGAAIEAGLQAVVPVPQGCTVVAARIVADQSGSAVVDVWADSFANYPPTDADSITASAPVTLSAAQTAEDTTLTGWTTSLTGGDWLVFNVDSASTVERLIVTLWVEY